MPRLRSGEIARQCPRSEHGTQSGRHGCTRGRVAHKSASRSPRCRGSGAMSWIRSQQPDPSSAGTNSPTRLRRVASHCRSPQIHVPADNLDLGRAAKRVWLGEGISYLLHTTTVFALGIRHRQPAKIVILDGNSLMLRCEKHYLPLQKCQACNGQPGRSGGTCSVCRNTGQVCPQCGGYWKR